MITNNVTLNSPTYKGFQDNYSNIEKIRIQAQAQNNNGFLVRQDFLPAIGDYRVKETVLWQLIRKVYAKEATIKEMLKTNRPVISFTDRNNLDTAPENPIGTLDKDLTDPGQDLKALTGFIELDNFGRSLYEQQGRPYYEQVSEYSSEMITQALRTLEYALIDGDATRGNGYEFNGFTKQMDPSQVVAATKIGSTPDLITDKLDETILKGTYDRDIKRKITHILCSAAGYRNIQREMKELQIYQNMTEIIPGVKVPSILTAHGTTPIIVSPHILDIPADPVLNTPERLCYWLIDISQIEWHGLVPFGGQRTMDPQIFDVNNVINGKPLLEKRFLIQYGTLFVKNRGRGIYKVEVDVPDNTIWN